MSDPRVARDAPQAQAVAPADGVADPVTPYDRLAWTGEEAEKLLASGERHQELIAFFGPNAYRELAGLAQTARDAPAAPGTCRTFILPGILGSQLGFPRRTPQPRDILWLDPIDIGRGRVLELALSERSAVQRYGVLLYAYLGLGLQLRAAGVDAIFCPYDWRLGIDTLGRELAERLRAEPAPRVALVAHSLGGLVARAALAHPGGEKVQRLVLLGTPNCGSLAALQALRGTYWAVRKIAQLDQLHSSETLASRVFTTFPSLYHMLPVADSWYPGLDGRKASIDLLDPAAWPDSDPRPVPQLLESARAVSRALAGPDERCVSILGVGQPTAMAVARKGDEFVYRITREGDGTVPAASARFGPRNYYARVNHSDLTRDPNVVAAVLDLLVSGTTRRLAPRWRNRNRAEMTIGDRALGGMLTDKVHWASLTGEARRSFLEYLNVPPRLPLSVPRAG